MSVPEDYPRQLADMVIARKELKSSAFITELGQVDGARNFLYIANQGKGSDELFAIQVFPSEGRIHTIIIDNNAHITSHFERNKVVLTADSVNPWKANDLKVVTYQYNKSKTKGLTASAMMHDYEHHKIYRASSVNLQRLFRRFIPLLHEVRSNFRNNLQVNARYPQSMATMAKNFDTFFAEHGTAANAEDKGTASLDTALDRWLEHKDTNPIHIDDTDPGSAAPENDAPENAAPENAAPVEPEVPKGEPHPNLHLLDDTQVIPWGDDTSFIIKLLPQKGKPPTAKAMADRVRALNETLLAEYDGFSRPLSLTFNEIRIGAATGDFLRLLAEKRREKPKVEVFAFRDAMPSAATLPVKPPPKAHTPPAPDPADPKAAEKAIADLARAVLAAMYPQPGAPGAAPPKPKETFDMAWLEDTRVRHNIGRRAVDGSTHFSIQLRPKTGEDSTELRIRVQVLCDRIMAACSDQIQACRVYEDRFSLSHVTGALQQQLEQKRVADLLDVPIDTPVTTANVPATPESAGSAPVIKESPDALWQGASVTMLSEDTPGLFKIRFQPQGGEGLRDIRRKATVLHRELLNAYGGDIAISDTVGNQIRLVAKQRSKLLGLLTQISTGTPAAIVLGASQTSPTASSPTVTAVPVEESPLFVGINVITDPLYPNVTGRYVVTLAEKRGDPDARKAQSLTFISAVGDAFKGCYDNMRVTLVPEKVVIYGARGKLLEQLEAKLQREAAAGPGGPTTRPGGLPGSPGR